jgi:hypothetical protein
MGNQRLSAESGFVIPYVLGVILVVSLLVLWSANSLRDTQNVFIQLSETNRDSQSLDAAETQFLQLFLGATMIRQGLDVSGRPVDETALALGDPPPEEGLTPEDIWSAQGGLKVFTWNGQKIAAIYQDSDGLLSLNSSDIKYLTKWLSSGEYADAESMAAKFGDYRDDDNIRRFRGAERSEYRLLQRPPPSNSYIRNITELNSILDWEEFVPTLSLHDLRHLTLAASSTVPRLAAVPEDLKTRLGLVADGQVFLSQDDLNDAELFLSNFPSSRSQLTLVRKSGSGSPYWVRIVEIERTGGAPDRPFTRRLLWEGAASDGDISEPVKQALQTP